LQQQSERRSQAIRYKFCEAASPTPPARKDYSKAAQVKSSRLRSFINSQCD
jgi:hypothetical protein